ncbi:MAG: Hsp20/alpha crystallin family protein [Burkholderiales bacterium]|nr:Hsp20/alpha crystallin family protein [Burkholderiales bacterium]
MANIRPFDVFPTGLEDFFKGTFLRPVRFDLDQPDMQIKLNVTHGEGAYSVDAEMPGVKKDDIHVTIEGSLVTIAGEVKKEKEEKKGDRVIRSERYFGKIERSFSLPQDIDAAAVAAKYEDGVLKLTLPLREKQAGKTIKIA